MTNDARHWARQNTLASCACWMGLEPIKGSGGGGDDMCAYNTILNIILTIFDHFGAKYAYLTVLFYI